MIRCLKCKNINENKNVNGFDNGTCKVCGWNYLSKQWEFIKVKVDDLPEELQDYLIQKHEMRYENPNK